MFKIWTAFGPTTYKYSNEIVSYKFDNVSPHRNIYSNKRIGFFLIE